MNNIIDTYPFKVKILNPLNKEVTQVLEQTFLIDEVIMIDDEAYFYNSTNDHFETIPKDENAAIKSISVADYLRKVLDVTEETKIQVDPPVLNF